MEIVVLPIPDGNKVGQVFQHGVAEADFVVADSGVVIYRSRLEDAEWVAAPSVEVLRAAALSWSNYCRDLKLAMSGEAELQVVSCLLKELDDLGLIGPQTGNVWGTLVEQEGLL